MKKTKNTGRLICHGQSIYGLHQTKTCLWAYADSKGPDQQSVQSDQSLHCLLTGSMDTTEHMNGEQRPRCSYDMKVVTKE